MNIGFLLVHPNNESLGSVSLVRDLAKGLIKFGHTCYIFSPYEYTENWGDSVFFQKMDTFGPNSGLSKRIYKIARWILNIPFISKYLILSKFNFNKMISNLSSSLIQAIKKNSIALDLLEGEQEIGGLAALRSKKELNIPIIVHLHNFWPEELVIEHIVKKNDSHYQFLINIEKEILANADFVFTPGTMFRDFLINEYQIDPSKIAVLFHGGFPRLEETKERANPPCIIYSGLVVKRANVELLLESIPYVLKQRPDVKFYICNKGESLNNIKKLAKKRQLPINFYWFEKFEDYLELISSCTAGILTSNDDLPRRFGPASKLYDYLSMGVPVVANDIGSWTQIISDEQVGLLSENNPEKFAEKILIFVNDSDLSKNYGQNGIHLVQMRANWNLIIQNEILPIYEQIYSKKSK